MCTGPRGDKILGNFLVYDFWTLTLLSILYMHLIFNTWIKWVMWPQRPTPEPVLAAALGLRGGYRI